MAVRPWENRFLDINLRDGVMVHESESAEGKNGTKSQFKSSGKKPIASISNLELNPSSQKMGPSHSDGCSSSPSTSAGMQEVSNTLLPKPKPKPQTDNPVEEANSRPGGGLRSHSNPKERFTQPDKQPKKRLSLPNSSEFYLSLSLSIYLVILLPDPGSSFLWKKCSLD